ncbi:MAG: DNA cytosine methyltransferase, partial [Oscillospiraceae bacterium]|nr:DNA cytosine methyltransferase [Oscillospiraceae bacterium]
GAHPCPRDSEEVKSGKCQPWRSAAEIIDWTEPMYSIFATKAAIKAQYGVNAVRPLADNTLRRIIRGVDKFTIKSGKPFIVQGKFQNAPQDIDRPLTTVTAVGAHEVVNPILQPFLAECNHSGAGHIAEVGKPIGTVTQKCTMGLCAPKLAPITLPNTCNSVGSPADQPVHTITTAGNQILAAANLFQYHTEQTEDARVSGLEAALPTVDGSNRHGLVSTHLVEYYGNGQPIDPQEPMHTATSHDREALTATFLQPFHAGGYHGKGNPPEEPCNTITSSGGQSLVAAHVVKFKGDNLGTRLADPLQTITTNNEFATAAVRIAKYAPGAALGYWPEVRALLNKYCGYNLAGDEILLLWVCGAWHYINDIAMRMLTPRELYAAMGFPPDYIINRDYTGKAYPKTKQVARCGNAVCPPMATAVVKANMPEWSVTINTMDELMHAMAI